MGGIAAMACRRLRLGRFVLESIELLHRHGAERQIETQGEIFLLALLIRSACGEKVRPNAFQASVLR